MKSTILKRLQIWAVAVLTLLIPRMEISAQVNEKWIARYDGPANGSDEVSSLALDSFGNIIAAGRSQGVGTSQDYCTVKCDSSGDEVWLQRYNGYGNSTDFIQSLFVDTDGNIYVTGYSTGSGGGYDCVTIKYNAEGVTQWTAVYSGSANGDDGGESIAVDDAGNVYIAVTSFRGNTGLDMVTVKYNADGLQIWEAVFDGPGTGDDYARIIKLNSSGDVVVSGTCSGIGLNRDFVTVKYSSSGGELWTEIWDGPGNGNDTIYDMAVGMDGSVHVTGYCFIHESYPSNDYDYATVKYSSAGQELWEATYDGPAGSFDTAESIAVDGDGNVFVTGTCYGGQTKEDIATIKYSPSGEQVWVSRYDGNLSEYDGGSCIVLDEEGNVYVTGRCNGLIGGSAYDYVTLKYTTSGEREWAAIYSGPVPSGNDVAKKVVLDSSANVYITGSSAGNGSQSDYATLCYEQGNPEVWINLTPAGMTTFPASGGIMEYNIAIGNDEFNPIIADIWIDVTLPNLTVFGPIVGPVLDFTLQAGFVGSRDRQLVIPAGAPTGVYHLNAAIGDYAIGSTIIEDHFTFEKAGADGFPVSEFQFTDVGEFFAGETYRGAQKKNMVGILEVHPNPFNPVTALSYKLQATSFVNLAVYDILGRLVAELVDCWLDAGYHKFTFDGSHLTSGVYIYRLIAGDYRATGKMILMK